jgi:hypothetical protein
MSFYIQVSNPTFLNPTESFDDSLKEVIEDIFPYEAEYAFLAWNGLPIPLRYKYDVNRILNSVLSLINLLLDSEEIPGFPIKLDCFAFTASWYVSCTGDSLKITSEWSRVDGGYEDWLNARSQLDIKKSTFIFEWKALLIKIIEAIEKSNLNVDKKSLVDLRKTESAITSFGKLYQKFPLSKSTEVSKIVTL